MGSNKASIEELIKIIYPNSQYPAYDIKHIYLLLGEIEKHYTQYAVKKKNGKTRIISMPDSHLKKCQKRIYKYILKDAQIADCAAAYVKGKTIKDSLQKHVGHPIMLKLDIKSFFDSISFDMVRKAFKQLNFDDYQALSLARLCTYKGRLPQGAPTSPMLSNIIMKNFDATVSKFCLSHSIEYTRYCDDMVFSGNFDPKPLVAFIKTVLYENGFRLNKRKVKIIKQGQRQMALGVVLNEKEQVSKEYRRKIRQEIYYCKKFSPENHLLHTNNEKYVCTDGTAITELYQKNLYGRIQYALQINPDDKELQLYAKMTTTKRPRY